MARRSTGVGDVEEACERAIVSRQNTVLPISQIELARIVEFEWLETDERRCRIW